MTSLTDLQHQLSSGAVGALKRLPASSPRRRARLHADGVRLRVSHAIVPGHGKTVMTRGLSAPGGALEAIAHDRLFSVSLGVQAA